MIRKPIWARCRDRSSLAKSHEYSGSPEDWFADVLLPNGYTGISFDFFVNWSTNSLSNEIWIKRIIDDKYYWPQTNKSSLEHDLYKCDSQEYIKTLGSFVTQCHLKLNYQLFKESKDWRNNPSDFGTVAIDNKGKVSNVKYQSITDIKNEIQLLSGGPVRVGGKGLGYSSTTLECFLANEDKLSGAAWPGDVDLLILDKNLIPIAMLEFKKNTIRPNSPYGKHIPISEEYLSNYYPNPDKRKYDRLAILRDYLNKHFQKTIPIFNIYFPTWKNSTYMKIEHIIGDIGNLQSNPENVTIRPLPRDSKEMKKITMSLFSMI